MNQKQGFAPADVVAALPDLQSWSHVADGGFSEIWLAREPALSRQVIVKVLHSGPGGHAPAAFEAEAKIWGSLSHPNITPIYRHGVTTAGRPYLVLQHCSKGSLQDRLHKTGPLPVAEALAVVAQIASALEYAHDRRVLHLDIKPSNILIDEHGVARLCDFGVARSIQDGLPSTTEHAFTPEYAAPELLDGTNDLGPHTDTWSLAATLGALLVGQSPFAAGSPSEVAALVRSGSPRPLPDVPGVTDTIRTAWAQALALDSPIRTGSPLAFATSLLGPGASGSQPTSPTTLDSGPWSGGIRGVMLGVFSRRLLAGRG